MTLSDEFLEQARRLAAGMSQIDRRRAVSGTYYALFHAIGEEFASRFRPDQQARAARVIEHGTLKTAAKRIESSSRIQGRLCPEALLSVARLVPQLQQARHDADYDAARPFAQLEVQELYIRATSAMAVLRWSATNTPDDLEAFLMELVLPYRQGR